MLTTHAGSLPRPAALVAMMRARDTGQPYDAAALAGDVTAAVNKIVRQQAEHGLDIVNDGEQSKPSFLTYVAERLGGFERIEGQYGGSPWSGSREFASFPEFYEAEAQAREDDDRPTGLIRMICNGPVTYRGQAQVATDIANLKAALADVSHEEVFIPAISPANIEDYHENQFYDSGEEYLFAIAEAMGEEYKAITDAGFLLQIDDPRLVTFYIMNPGISVADCRRWMEQRIEAINHALRGIPPESVRYHTCYSINMGPRIHDMEMKDIADLLLKINAQAYSFEASNPRHEHEWRVWEEVKLPAGKILIPGVITQSTVVVEHPELIAERLARFANLVGRENVIAGADCGFATFAGSNEIHETIVWAKFDALVAGARLASGRLW